MYKRVHSWFRNNKLHFLIWTIYILYETIVLGLFFDYFDPLSVYILHYSAIILLFYIYADILLTWGFKRKHNRLIWIILVSALEITSFIYIHYGIDRFLIITGLASFDGSFNLNRIVILKHLYRGLYFTLTAVGYYYLKTYLKERLRTAGLEKQLLEDIIQKQQIEKELSQAENAFLKAQINPHFLFNTLDFVYHEVNATSPKAGETIISLSNMMRYAVDAEYQADKVPLINEINQVEELIKIHRFRNEKLQFEFSYGLELSSLCIIPLVLLTLVENMFKHGQLNRTDKPAIFSLKLLEGYLQITTRNALGPSPAISSHRKGLENIRKRLELAYGPDATLTYGAIDGIFELKLSIAEECLT